MNDLWTSKLATRFQDFCTKCQNTLHIVCPFIRLEALKTILEGQETGKCNLVIITTWNLEDLIQGYSDLEIYPWVKECGGYIYINKRLHAKILIDNCVKCVLSTANITEKGLGLRSNENIEAAVEISNFSFESQYWLQRLLFDSVLVQDPYYQAICQQFKAERKPVSNNYNFDSAIFENEKHFLISSLPASESPASFIEIMKLIQKNQTDGVDPATLQCALHDSALYGINLEDSFDDSIEKLKNNFFSQAFIRELTLFIGKKRFFGEVKEWIQNNCTNVPVPKRRDLTETVQILFSWLSTESFDAYYIVQPNYSQAIVKK